MFDNLRDDAASSFYEEDTQPPDEEAIAAVAPRRKPGGKLWGMTPIQRFIIAVMLMLTVCILGMMCLLVTGKIGLI
jgi:hypothetical protein